jgi:hypothetical protein
LRGIHLSDEPLRTCRRLLESLVPDLAPPLQITPAIRDRAVAQNWLRDYAAGIEGLL